MHINISRFLTIATLAMAFTTFHATAQELKEDEIDYDYRYCKKKDTSTSNICDCAFQAYGKWSKEMDNSLKRLDKYLKKEEDRKALKQAQATWESYRDAEFTLYDFMFNKPGSYYCELRQDGRIDIVRTRTVQLRNYYEALRLRE